MALISLVLPDIRSAQNVGAILRTADAVGATMVLTCGYTPHGRTADDPRPAHVIAANERALAKTALGAEQTVTQRYFADLVGALAYVRRLHYDVVALEQTERSVDLFAYAAGDRLALVVGNEVTGLDAAALASCDAVLELPMVGRKESLNVAVSAGIALYVLAYGRGLSGGAGTGGAGVTASG